jgi:hypothetical protein
MCTPDAEKRRGPPSDGPSVGERACVASADRAKRRKLNVRKISPSAFSQSAIAPEISAQLFSENRA